MSLPWNSLIIVLMIYNIALENTAFSIMELEKIIATGIMNSEKIRKIIPNRSAITGDVCGKKLSYIKYRGSSHE